MKRKVIDRLRERYPYKQWKAVRDGFGWRYVTDDGWSAEWRSVLSPQYDGDDETAVPRLFLYKPNESVAEVFL